jgi:uncharacterized protein (TIGR02757 family)
LPTRINLDDARLKQFLDQKLLLYNQPSFIAKDPISIPHLFRKKQDIEIAGFFASIFAWGQRPTIIKKAGSLMELMDNAPYHFCRDHSSRELKTLLSFRHRTFNPTDLLYFIAFLKHHYGQHSSLETAFTMHGKNMEQMLAGFHHYFFSIENDPPRTRKHIATPERKSSCKRLNMYLRWMVRKDKSGVDFGLWKKISPSELVCPLDLHVARVARKLGLLTRRQNDWKAAMELTSHLRGFDRKDPVKYDFALFGLGIFEKF